MVVVVVSAALLRPLLWLLLTTLLLLFYTCGGGRCLFFPSCFVVVGWTSDVFVVVLAILTEHIYMYQCVLICDVRVCACQYISYVHVCA